jgi:uncharacterized protein (DUF58 family)
MIPREILKKIRQIELRTRRIVSESFAGQYHSVFKGQGMNFEEVREYQPGDEVRAIDWNVTARMNHPFVKKFVEERELSVLLIVDLSASGVFGSQEQSKRELAAELASVLAFSAIRNNDKVGLVLFTEGVEKFIPPNKGRRHVLRVIREILFFKPEKRGTDLVTALDYARKMTAHRSIMVVISDFLTRNVGMRPGTNRSAGLLRGETLVQSSYKTLQLLNRQHDLIAIQVIDPREMELPDLGIIVMKDAETGELVEFNTSNRKQRVAFVERQKRVQGEISRVFKSAQVDFLQVTTDRPYARELAGFFKARLKRLRRG